MCFYTESVDIKRLTTIDLGSGSFSKSYDVVHSNVPASMQPEDLIDIIRAGRKINSRAYNCFFKPDVDVSGADRITYLGDDYAIISTQSWPNEYIECNLEQIIP